MAFTLRMEQGVRRMGEASPSPASPRSTSISPAAAPPMRSTSTASTTSGLSSAHEAETALVQDLELLAKARRVISLREQCLDGQ